MTNGMNGCARGLWVVGCGYKHPDQAWCGDSGLQGLPCDLYLTGLPTVPPSDICDTWLVSSSMCDGHVVGWSSRVQHYHETHHHHRSRIVYGLFGPLLVVALLSTMLGYYETFRAVCSDNIVIFDYQHVV